MFAEAKYKGRTCLLNRLFAYVESCQCTDSGCQSSWCKLRKSLNILKYISLFSFIYVLTKTTVSHFAVYKNIEESLKYTSVCLLLCNGLSCLLFAKIITQSFSAQHFSLNRLLKQPFDIIIQRGIVTWSTEGLPLVILPTIDRQGLTQSIILERWLFRDFFRGYFATNTFYTEFLFSSLEPRKTDNQSFFWSYFERPVCQSQILQWLWSPRQQPDDCFPFPPWNWN